MAFGVLPTQNQPPAEIPQVQIPSPDFKTIGQAVGAGVQDSGFIGKLWDGFINILGRAFVIILTVIVKSATGIAVFWANTFTTLENENKESFNKLAQAAILDLFDVNVQIAGVGTPGSRGGRKGAADSIGQALLTAMLGEFTGGNASTLRPTSAPAQRFISHAAQLALEGWLEGWIFEALSLGSLEKFADLDDMMERVLGIGTATSRITAPAVDALITTPFEWLINETYRPKLLTARHIKHAVDRGRMTKEAANTMLARQGYSTESIEVLLAVEGKYLSVDDLDFLVSHGTWTQDQAITHLRDQGYTQEIAAAELAIAEVKRLDVWRRQRADFAGTQFAKKLIPQDQFLRILETSGLSDREQRQIHLTYGLRREFVHQDISLSDMEAAIKRGILNIQDYRIRLLNDGYDLRDVQTLELLLNSEINDAAKAAAARRKLEEERNAAAAARAEQLRKKREAAAGQVATKNISLSQFEALVRQGVRSVEQYRVFLASQGFSAGDQEDLTTLLSEELADAAAKAKARADLKAAADVRQVNVSQVERAVKRGVLSLAEYESFLAQNKFAPESAAILVSSLQAELDAQAAAEARHQAAAEKLAAEKVSLADIETAVRRGLVSVDQYAATLNGRGFSSEDQDLLASLLKQQIADDDAARKRREEAAAQLKQRKLSLADEEKAVRAGVKTLADYRGFLGSAGFSSDDQDTLEALLKLQIAADTQDAARRKAAEERLAQRGISISDLARAVKLGVTPVATYTAALQKAGLDAADQDILTRALVAELAAIAAERKRRETLANHLKRKQISLADLEKAARAGLRSIAEYSTFLRDQGFNAADQATLTALLQLQVDQDKALAAKRAAVEAALAMKHVSLADLERAVLLGVTPMDTYSAALAGAGFASPDISILVATLSARLKQTQAAATKEKTVTRQLAGRGLSQTDLEAAVLGGVRPIADYRAFLAVAGYKAADVETLVELLALRVEQKVASDARHASISGDLGARGLSLAQVEQGVVRRALTMADYAEFLDQQGYGDLDQAVLVSLLQAKLAAAAAPAAA